MINAAVKVPKGAFTQRSLLVGLKGYVVNVALSDQRVEVVELLDDFKRPRMISLDVRNSDGVGSKG